MSWDIFSKSKIQYFLQKLKDKFVQKETGKGLSTNDFVANNTVLTTDKTPFLTRQTLNPTGFSGYVREKLIGASYAWNQLVTFTYVGGSGYAYTRSLHSITINDATATNFNAQQYYLTDEYLIPNHIYYLRTISNSTYFRLFNYYTGATYTANNGLLYKQGSPAWRLNLGFVQGITNGTYSLDVIITDLTLAFGSTIADYLYSLANNGGITKLRDMGCPIDKYTPYGYGLYSVKTSGKKIVGFNQWDEVWEQGDYNNAGVKVSGDGIRSANKIPILPNTLYYWRPNYTGNTYYWVCEYDANQKFISRIAIYPGIYTPSANTRFIAFNTASAYGGTYKNDICFNINDANKNGQYEPYCGYEISLGNDELRGKFDLVDGEIVASGDVKESNGNVTRKYGIVDLGTLTWQYSSGGFFYANDLPYATVKNTLNCICEKYVRTSDYNGQSVATEDKTFAVFPSYWFDDTKTKSVAIRDTSYGSDYSAFKTAMSGIYLIYELATPATVQSTPFADPMSMVGATTEEYIDTRDIPCPVGAERQYMGQSEDVIEIPSMPQSDGIRYMKAITSGGKTQLVWEDNIVEDVTSKFVMDSTNVYQSTMRVLKIGKMVFINGGIRPQVLTSLQNKKLFDITDSRLLPLVGTSNNITANFVPVETAQSTTLPLIVVVNSAYNQLRTSNNGAYGGITNITTSSLILFSGTYICRG